MDNRQLAEKNKHRFILNLIYAVKRGHAQELKRLMHSDLFQSSDFLLDYNIKPNIEVIKFYKKIHFETFIQFIIKINKKFHLTTIDIIPIYFLRGEDVNFEYHLANSTEKEINKVHENVIFVSAINGRSELMSVLVKNTNDKGIAIRGYLIGQHFTLINDIFSELSDPLFEDEHFKEKNALMYALCEDFKKYISLNFTSLRKFFTEIEITRTYPGFINRIKNIAGLDTKILLQEAIAINQCMMEIKVDYEIGFIYFKLKQDKAALTWLSKCGKYYNEKEICADIKRPKFFSRADEEKIFLLYKKIFPNDYQKTFYPKLRESLYATLPDEINLQYPKIYDIIWLCNTHGALALLKHYQRSIKISNIFTNTENVSNLRIVNQALRYFSQINVNAHDVLTYFENNLDPNFNKDDDLVILLKYIAFKIHCSFSPNARVGVLQPINIIN